MRRSEDSAPEAFEDRDTVPGPGSIDHGQDNDVGICKSAYGNVIMTDISI